MKEGLRKLIRENRLKDAIQRLEDLSKGLSDTDLRDDVILLISRYRDALRNKHNGTLKDAEAQAEQEEIKKAILAIADRIPARINRLTTALIAISLIIAASAGYKFFSSTDPKADFVSSEKPISIDCIQPFADEETFQILILPFATGSDLSSGSNLAAELLLRIEDIKKTEDIRFSIHYWDDFKNDSPITKERAAEILTCSEADLVIYGGFWSSEKTDQGQLRIEYDLHPDVKEVLDLFGDNLRELFSGQSTPFFASVAEIEQKFFTGQLSDIARIEQLVYWLASIGKMAYDDCDAANQLAAKAYSYDTENVELLMWKLVIQYLDENFLGIISDVDGVPDTLLNTELSMFKYLALFFSNQVQTLDAELQKLIQQTPESSSTRFLFNITCMMYLKLGKLHDAMRIIDSFERSNGSLPSMLVWWKFRLLYQLEGMSPKLEAEIALSLQHEYRAIAAECFLAEYYVSQQQYDQALLHYEELESQFHVDSALYTVIDGEDDELVWTWQISTAPIYSSIGNIYYLRGDNELAEAYFERGLRHASPLAAPTLKLNLAILQLQNKSALSTRALDSLEEVLIGIIASQSISSADAHKYLGSLYEYRGDFQDAIWHAEESMCDGRNKDESLPVKAFSLGQLGYVEESYDTWKDFVELDPTTSEDYLKVGVSLGQQGYASYAIEMLETGIDCTLEQQDTATYSAFLPVIGMQYLLEDSLALALNSFTKLRSLEPNSGEYASIEILLAGILGLIEYSYATSIEFVAGDKRIYYDQYIDDIANQIGVFYEFLLCLGLPQNQEGIQRTTEESFDELISLQELLTAQALICSGELESGKVKLDSYMEHNFPSGKTPDLLALYAQATYAIAQEDYNLALRYLDKAIFVGKNMSKLSLEEIPVILYGAPTGPYISTMVYNHLFVMKMHIHAAFEDYEAVFKVATAAERQGVKNLHIRATYLELRALYGDN